MMSRRFLRVISYAQVLMLILISSALTGFAAGISPSESYYVYDKADYLSEDYEKYIINTNKALFNLTGAQVVIVTVEDTENASLEEYASQIFSEWKIGSIERNNGILFIISKKDGNYFVAKGKGFKDSLSDDELKTLLSDKFEVHFNAGMYETGIISFFDSLIDRLEKLYNVSVSEWNGKGGIYTNALSNNSSEQASSVMHVIVIIIISLIIITIIFLAVYLEISKNKIYGQVFYSSRRNKRKRQPGLNSYSKIYTESKKNIRGKKYSHNGYDRINHKQNYGTSDSFHTGASTYRSKNFPEYTASQRLAISSAGISSRSNNSKRSGAGVMYNTSRSNIKYGGNSRSEDLRYRDDMRFDGSTRYKNGMRFKDDTRYGDNTYYRGKADSIRINSKNDVIHNSKADPSNMRYRSNVGSVDLHSGNNIRFAERYPNTPKPSNAHAVNDGRHVSGSYNIPISAAQKKNLEYSMQISRNAFKNRRKENEGPYKIQKGKYNKHIQNYLSENTSKRQYEYR